MSKSKDESKQIFLEPDARKDTRAPAPN